MSPHTPGPWALHIDERAVFGAGPNRQQVVDCDVCSGNLPASERTANAYLIAAAPELLEALKEMKVACAAAMRVIARIDAGTLIGARADTFEQAFVDEAHMSGISDGVGVRADAAIAKAEGR